MKFRFPDRHHRRDFRSENTSGLGIRALAEAIEKEGMEVLGVTSYGDLSQFAQQQSRASAFILSIDDEEFTPGPGSRPGGRSTCASSSRRSASRTPRSRSTCTARRAPRGTFPNDILRELHGFIHMFEDTPEFVARHIIRETKAYLDSLAPPFFRALVDYAQDGSYSWHCPGHSGGVAFLKSPVGQMFHQFFGENMLRADVCNAVDELGQLLDHTGPVAAAERNAARIFNADHCFFVTNGTSTSNKMVWHANVAPGRHRRRRPQLPRVDPARDHDDRRDPGVPDADAQPPRHHRPDPARGVHAGEHPEEDRGQPVRARGEEQEAADPDAHAEHLRRHRLQRRDAEADAGRQHRHAALRRGLAAARDVPRFLQGHARDRQGPAAQQGRDDLRDALDAQAARRHLAGVADHRAGVARRASSTGTSSTRRT